MGGVLEPLLTPQRKDYRLSWLCGRSWGEKSFPCTNEGLFIANSETNPCDFSTTLMTIWIPWIFNFTWLFVQKVGLLDFHVTLHWLTVWPTIEMWMTWLITWLDMIVMIHSYYYWCAYRAIVLFGDGCPHVMSQHHLRMEKCVESCWFTWCFFFTFLLACMLDSLKGSSISEECMFVYPSVYEHIFLVFSCIRLWTHICMIIYSRPHLFACIFCSLSHHVCLCTCACNHSWNDDIKSRNLLVYHDTRSF